MKKLAVVLLAGCAAQLANGAEIEGVVTSAKGPEAGVWVIDDPGAGWKGRGLWATYSTRAMFHLEGGKESRPKAVKFQLRPDPLAK